MQTRLADLWALSKPRVTLLVLITAFAGVVAAPGHASVLSIVTALMGIALVVAGANALNMYLERDIDGLMSRTRNRPLPAGRMAPSWALAFGLATGIVATLLLGLHHNWLTGALAGASLLVYVWVYTPLKRRSWAALLIGAVPGAMPPLLGWTAMTGRLDAGALILFAVLFLWQLPHFMAISVFRGDEYARAGICTVPAAHGETGARAFAIVCAAMLLVVSLGGPSLGVGRGVSAGLALLFGGGFVVLAARPLDVDGGHRWARQLFFFSLLYLPVVLGAMACGV